MTDTSILKEDGIETCSRMQRSSFVQSIRFQLL